MLRFWKAGSSALPKILLKTMTPRGPRSPATLCATCALPVCPSFHLWVDGPTWRVSLGLPKAPQGDDAPLFGNPTTALSFYPLVVNDQVLIADAQTVTSFDLFTGKQLFHFQLPPEVVKDGKTQGLAGARYTLTAWNNLVFARLGSQTIGPDSAAGSSQLVCLALADLPSADHARRGELRWQIKAVGPENQSAFFEGTPLAAHGNVYCAVSWVLDKRTHTAIACHEAATGKRRWIQEVCDTPEFEDHAEARTRQHLLTLGGGRIYYCSHAGTVAALDPWTGQRLWGTRYLSLGPKTDEGAPSPRELAPCIYHDGRLFVAPLDADALYCFDASNGQVAWKQDVSDVVHLLGVSRERVFFTTTRGLQSVEVVGSSARGRWQQPAEGRLPPFGRGLLAGSWLLWPTQDPQFPLRGVTLAEGLQERFSTPASSATVAPPEPEFFEPTMLRALRPGNMAFGQGCLVVAGANELVVYVPHKDALRRQQKVPDAHAAPPALYELAMAQTDAGLGAEAAKTWARLREAGDEKWRQVSDERSAAMRGMLKNPWHLRCVPGRHAGLVKTSSDRPTLQLPLRKMLEMPVRITQDVACAATENAPLNLGLRGDELFCLDDATLQIRWAQSVLRDERTLWLGVHGDIGVRAGPDRLEGIQLADGTTRWTATIPLCSTSRYAVRAGMPWRLDNPFPPAHFQCNSHLLVFMVDQRLLVALDPTDGAFAWTYWAPGGPIRPLADDGLLNSHYQVGERYVLVQAAGTWRVLDSQTGALLHSGPALQRWVAPPLPLDDRHFVLSSNAGQLFLLDAAAGSIVWTYQPPGPTSLSGAPSLAVGDKRCLLAIVSRNIGCELMHLDIGTGACLWSTPILPGNLTENAVAVGAGSVFFACENRLEARSLSDGKRLWQKQLPTRLAQPARSAHCSWQVKPVGGFLLIFPRQAARVPTLWPRPFSWPLFGHSQNDGEPAILVLDARDGQWVQQLPLTGSPGPIQLRVRADRLVVNAGNRMSVFGQ